MSRISLGLTALALGVASVSPQSVSAATLYSVLDLSSLLEVNSGTTFATGINDNGQVVGVTTSAFPTGLPQAFRSAPNLPINQLTDTFELVPGLSNSTSSDINNSGQIVGTYIGRGGQRNIGFRTTPNGPIDNTSFISDRANGSLGNVDVVPFVYAAAGINELGQVVGKGLIRNSDGQIGYDGGVLIKDPNNSTEEVIQLGEAIAFEDINDLGQIVGTSGQLDFQGVPINDTLRAFRTAPNSVTQIDLGTLGGTSSRGLDINNLGQVVGSSTTTDGQTRAFLTAANSAINPETDNLGTLGSSFTQANAVNELGQVVGYSGDLAFLYENGTMFDLNDLIDGTVDTQLVRATGINERGQIVANSYSRAYLLTPVPEPASMLGVLAFGAGAGVLHTTVKRKVSN